MHRPRKAQKRLHIVVFQRIKNWNETKIKVEIRHITNFNDTCFAFLTNIASRSIHIQLRDSVCQICTILLPPQRGCRMLRQPLLLYPQNNRWSVLNSSEKTVKGSLFQRRKAQKRQPHSAVAFFYVFTSYLMVMIFSFSIGRRLLYSSQTNTFTVSGATSPS